MVPPPVTTTATSTIISSGCSEYQEPSSVAPFPRVLPRTNCIGSPPVAAPAPVAASRLASPILPPPNRIDSMASSLPAAADEAPRVKILCSFGGSILPRPVDGRLRYVGGETRIVSLPRDILFEDLIARMRDLFDAVAVVKYQQPDEDLDALVSVVNDDDVTNMMEEHDKLAPTPEGVVRLRVFLFSHNDLAVPSLLLDDDREADRRYVDALNCVPEATPPSFDYLHHLSRASIPRRPSYGQLYPDVDSPATYYSPGQLTPRDHREFSPSPTRFHDYDHISPFADGGSMVWVPPIGVVPDMAGFPGNLGHNHGNAYEGSGGCEQCRIALQHGQDQRYYDAPRGRHYGPFHPEQPGIGAEVCGPPSVNSCPECVRQWEAYPINQQHQVLEHEHLDRPAYYHDFHVRDRGWVGHPHQFTHLPEEARLSRNGQQYLGEGAVMNYASAHGGLHAGSSLSSVHMGYPDSRYAYIGNEVGNEMYPDPYASLPPLRIPKQGEGTTRYSNIAPAYAQISDPSSSGHGPRRNASAPIGAGAGPTHEHQSGIVMPSTSGNYMGYTRELPEENQAFSRVMACDHLHNFRPNQGGSMPFVNLPVKGVAVTDFPPRLNSNILNQENSVPTLQEVLQVQGARCSVGNSHDDVLVTSLPAGLQSAAVANHHLPEVAYDKTAMLGEAHGNGQDTAVLTDAKHIPCLDIRTDHQTVNTKEKHQYEADDLPSLNSTPLIGDGKSCHENREYLVESMHILPEIIASVKQIALENAEAVKTKAEAGSGADSSPRHGSEEASKYEIPEQTDGCKDEIIDSDGGHALGREIEPTAAEREALAKGLQAIRNDDLEDIRELGNGAYGSVFHGKWKGTDVAIKRIKASCFSGKPSERERMISDFWKEALILSSLHHPNVVAFYGVVRDGPDGSLATVTEFMVNGSLKQFLQKKDRTIDRRKRLIIAMDAAFGMEYLHGKNIVHFDLKCENLLVNMRDPHRPICKIGDLGLSKVKQKTLVSGGVRGTLPWMAPELLSGKSKMVTEKVDVYSFGVVMWELLTGEDPYADMHCASIIGGIVNNTLRPQIPSWCDPEWKSLMESCWSSEPGERPSFLEISQRLRKMAAAMNLK